MPKQLKYYLLFLFVFTGTATMLYFVRGDYSKQAYYEKQQSQSTQADKTVQESVSDPKLESQQMHDLRCQTQAIIGQKC